MSGWDDNVVVYRNSFSAIWQIFTTSLEAISKPPRFFKAKRRDVVSVESNASAHIEHLINLETLRDTKPDMYSLRSSKYTTNIQEFHYLSVMLVIHRLVPGANHQWCFY